MACICTSSAWEDFPSHAFWGTLRGLVAPPAQGPAETPPLCPLSMLCALLELCAVPRNGS